MGNTNFAWVQHFLHHLAPPGIAGFRAGKRVDVLQHVWWDGEGYEDDPGFCKSATLEEIQKHGYVLTPGRYVGAAPQEDDGEPFEEKMSRLTAQWREQQVEAQRLDAEIEENLGRLGFGTRQSDHAQG